MGPERPTVVVTFGSADGVAELIGPDAEVRGLGGLQGDERRNVLSEADALLCWNWPREVSAEEAALLRARFVQLVSAGADHFPFGQLPPGAVLASNVGAYAEPMAEHVVAMALALLKRLPQRHRQLAEGAWDQSPTRSLSGTVCGILGFGGIGQGDGPPHAGARRSGARRQHVGAHRRDRRVRRHLGRPRRRARRIGRARGGTPPHPAHSGAPR
jgi:glycerate dehydrogenase